jgi:hypothetical protein
MKGISGGCRQQASASLGVIILLLCGNCTGTPDKPSDFPAGRGWQAGNELPREHSKRGVGFCHDLRVASVPGSG